MSAGQLGEDAPPGNFFDAHMVLDEPRIITKEMLLEVEALQAGLRTTRLKRKRFTAERDGLTIGWSGPQSSRLNAVAKQVCRDKAQTRDALAAHGLPIPEGASFPAGRLDAAREFALILGFPVAVKPAGGLKGIGVTAGITSKADLDRALQVVADSKYGETGIVVERHVTGADHRVLASPAHALSVIRRDPASVVGDGTRSIAALIEAKNRQRRFNPYLGRNPIRLDAAANRMLALRGMTHESVPASGDVVQLSPVGNLSRGGDSTEVLDDTHPTILDLASAAVRAVPGLDYGGVDILMSDHRCPADSQPTSIIEVNHSPALLMHLYPRQGAPRNVIRDIVREVAVAEGISVRPASGTLTLRVQFFGKVQRVGYRRWLARKARALDVDGWAGNAHVPDRVDAAMHGRPERVAMLLRAALRGPRKARPTRIEAVRVDVAPPRGFTVR